ncbi:bifunctional histidinol-phosphatase/imidazoleglycerol-phosphate dehydratase HisB [Sutterella sp.]|uniref:bifunctional histidinol-phosphatase/imidazoleglycerol-phosphate dehydratase HisB n=1 Tax=Sutterella sp. TaxID=1981025 RepID=UPI0026DFF16A|nr:bifunctional histidinol-phosphatase/imidazoleglycerol-phosphate dehydratase HisB [Sutterella sp.]MDO5531216.1 bifunctional histidinol-phosphatase/imidazoleglycerol-phosphate dehydratase HisB [Sutterella sp.]
MADRILFVDRDGTILEEPEDFQVDAFEKMRFVEGVLPALKTLSEAGWKLVMVSNQDGLGTKSFPEKTFTGPHSLMMQILTSQGVPFSEVLICPHMPGDGCECRKPRTGLVKKFLVPGAIDAANSYVIGDRETDLKLAENMGLTGLRVGPDGESWAAITERLLKTLPAPGPRDRHAKVVRKTKETDITVEAWLDRSGENEISTGIGFFDHMLDQIAVHGGIRLKVLCKGDLEIDDHHTVEDVGLALGEALRLALGDKRGIRRFGFLLPMDESLCRCALDISGRPYLTFSAKFKHRKVGDLSTEMVEHFFRSLSYAMAITLNLKAKGGNDHHIAESLFKAFGRSLRDAVRVEGAELPSSKGVL